eukprot:gene8164-9596_t
MSTQTVQAPTPRLDGKPKKKPLLGRNYLLAYNSFQALGWYYVVISLFMRVLFQGIDLAIPTTFRSLGSIVCTLQVFAFLEIANVYFGIVKTSLLPTVAQVLGRNHVLLVGLCFVYDVQFHYGVFCLFLFWGVSELIRYPFYITQILDDTPPFLNWLRYNAFIVLYPLGFAAENLLWYNMLPIIWEKRIHFLDLPNSINFSFNYYYLACAWIAFTMVGFPQQYLYMFSLRKKKMAMMASNEDAKKTM